MLKNLFISTLRLGLGSENSTQQQPMISIPLKLLTTQSLQVIFSVLNFRYSSFCKSRRLDP